MFVTIDWSLYLPLLKNFGLFALGMVIYCMFIFAFYKQVSRKILFPASWGDFKNSKHPVLLKFWKRLTYALKYVFLSPFLFFTWGAVITVLLFLFTGDEPIPVETTLLMSMALLASIRITAYYSEELSAELAKTLPLAILAVFLLDMASIDVVGFWNKMKLVPSILPTVVFYFLCVVVLEFILRIYDAIVNRE